MTSQPAPGTDGWRDEHLDEMERRGDSLLDAEAFHHSRSRQEIPDRVLMIQTSNGPFVAIDVPHRLYTVDEARNLANAILSELEIAQREGDGEW